MFKNYKISRLKLKGITKVTLIWTALWCLSQPCRQVTGLLCGSECDTQCKTVVQCPGNKIPDTCGCCLECAKQKGETCGGAYSMEGSCDVGLLCVTRPPTNGGLITQDILGICAEVSKKSDSPSKDPCSEIRCDNHLLLQQPTCPLDSKLAPINHHGDRGDDIDDDKIESICCSAHFKRLCQCLPCHSGSLVSCGDSMLPVLAIPGNMTPGNCCDVYRCVDKDDFCKTIQCNEPEVNEDVTGSCPDDSTVAPPDSMFDICCPRPLECECKTINTCPDINITCPQGTIKRILSHGTGLPGSCCDEYDCWDASSSTSCQHDNKTFHDDDEWMADGCMKCRCHSGLNRCFRVQCPDFPSDCEWVGHHGNDSCCPVCKGCSKNEKFYENNETWQEDICMTCRCVKGQSYCQAIFCGVKCSKPRMVEGLCCPVCEEENIPVILPPHCNLSEGCDLLCERGYARGRDGCPKCECAVDDDDEDDDYSPKEHCNPKCFSPEYITNPISGRKVCVCGEAPARNLSTVKPGCKSLIGCNRQCLYGYRNDSNGCSKCRCSRCPPLKCNKKCPAGYKINSDGCKICKCNDSGIFESPVSPGDHAYSNHHVFSAHKKGRPCSSANGRKLSDGQVWWDGCRRCFCHSSVEMCELISCPPIKCTNPILSPGSCCLTCPGVDPPRVLNNPGSCLSSDGRFFVDGETWSMDQCTLCLCHRGNPLCTIEACPPVLCHHPIHLTNSCCPICPHISDHGNTNLLVSSRKNPQQTNRTCLTSEGMKSSHGDAWRVSPCQSCVCIDGQINCFSQTCPILGCVRAALKKGHCCPSCLENPTRYCTYDGLTYDNGESWMVDDCMTCACMDGHVLCTTSFCEPPPCPHAILVPGKCCPECPGESTPCSHREHDRASGVETQINLTLIISLVTVIFLFAIIIILGMIIWLCHKFSRSNRRSSSGTIPTPLPSHNPLMYFGRRDQLNDEKSVSSSLQPLNSISGLVAGQQSGQRGSNSPIHLSVRKQNGDSSYKLRLSTGDPNFESHLSAGISSMTTASFASLSSSATKKRLSSVDGSSSNDGKLLGRCDMSKEDRTDPCSPQNTISSLPPLSPRRPPPSDDLFEVNVVVDNDDLGGSFDFERSMPPKTIDEHADKLSSETEVDRLSDASLNYEADVSAAPTSANYFRKKKNYSGDIDAEQTRHLLSSSPTGITPVNLRKSW